MTRWVFAGICVCVSLGSGCRRQAEAEANAAGGFVQVEVDGRAAPRIDAARLSAIPPDESSPEGSRLWRLSRVVAEVAAPGVRVEVEGGDRGVRSQLVLEERGNEPVLVLNRRGEFVIALEAGATGSPDFHGRGGNRGRSGNPTRRIRDVRTLRLWTQR